MIFPYDTVSFNRAVILFYEQYVGWHHCLISCRFVNHHVYL